MKNKLTYIAIAGLLSITSCSEENIQTGGADISDSRVISFQALLPNASESRGEEANKQNGIDHVQVTAYETGNSEPYFENERFRKRTDGNYHPIKVTNCLWPENGIGSVMEFYAYYPELDCFHRTGKYTMDTVRIASDISKQFDFMTAKGSAGIPDAKAKADNTVKLAFEHRLSRINIQATAGSNKDYKFEIAGIRIGNPAVEGKYIFTDLSDETSVGSWDLSNMKKGCVEYIFKAGDKIIDLDENEKSIMGNCGNAMLIPANIEAWNRPAVVPENLDYSYTTDEMYFSVLLRAKITDDITEYPYWDEKKHPGMKVVYLAVDSASNKVLARVYKGTVKEDNGEETLAYFLDEGTPAAENSDQETTEGQKREQYFLPEGASIREFGWAAVPVGVDWEAGQSYRYTIDYSNGIGYHDPDDPKPGKFIIDEQPVNIKVTVQPWKDATAEYNPIVTVPYE